MTIYVDFLTGLNPATIFAGLGGLQAKQLASFLGSITSISGGYVFVPTGFTWPFSTYPITITQTGPYKFTTNFVPETYAAAALAGTQYYVNGATGNDGNTGLSLAQAVKSIHVATTKGNAGGVPFRVAVASIPAGYPRENGFTNGGTVVPNTQPVAYIATGGNVTVWIGSVLAWPGSPDVTFPNTYKVARTLVSRVLNLTTNDANGDHAELTKVADAATCNSTPNSWAQVAGDLYVHRTGEQAVTSANTRVLLQTLANFFINGTSKDVYLSGFDLEGGTAGCFAMTAAATLNFMAIDCSAKFAGDAAVNVNGWKIDFITGLVALVRCVGACNVADGINGHRTDGGSGLNLLTIDCKGRNNGVVGTVQSCNGWTTHETVVSIDVNGEYYGNYGANFIPIGTTQSFALGTYCHDSVGDQGHGGATPPTDYQTQNTATAWLQNCRSAVSGISLIASNTSIIRTRNFLPGAGQTNGAGGGTISPF